MGYYVCEKCGEGMGGAPFICGKCSGLQIEAEKRAYAEKYERLDGRKVKHRKPTNVIPAKKKRKKVRRH